jgi:hypothetical protein
MIPLPQFSKKEEIFKIEEMLSDQDRNLRGIERYVLVKYLDSLKNEK